MSEPLISICIPAYKRTTYLRRLLDSIAIQTFTNFEVIISDDSNDTSVAALISEYPFSIRYFKNEIALGTPANWNAAMNKANGEYIKLMHDDDWFSNDNALELMKNALEMHNVDFVFSAYNNIYESTNRIEKKILSKNDFIKLTTQPLRFFKKNYIGHPSVIMHKRASNLFYDETFKWVVDFEAYMRWIKECKTFYYIDDGCINIGLGNEQVTFLAFRNKTIEIPENLNLLNKLGIDILKNIWVYDYYWRLLRNLSIKSIDDIVPFYPHDKIPSVIIKMIHHKSYLPPSILYKGIISKTAMFISYISTQQLK